MSEGSGCASDLTDDLASYAVGVRLEDAPQVVQEQVHLCILDTIGCVVAGSRVEDWKPLMEAEMASGTLPQATVIGTGTRLSAEAAARVNAYMGDVFELNDLIGGHASIGNGIEAKIFFTFFGLEAITNKKADHLHTATVGNPAFMPGMPTMVAGLPGFEAFASYMMMKEMDKLDMPHVTEFVQMIEAGGGEIYACKFAADMFHLKKEDFLPQVKAIITVGDMYALADGEGTQIVFI